MGLEGRWMPQWLWDSGRVSRELAGCRDAALLQLLNQIILPRNALPHQVTRLDVFRLFLLPCEVF